MTPRQLIIKAIQAERGTGASAKNARKLNCPDCGGPYQATKKGRMCRPCETVKERVRYHARKARLG